MRALSVLALGCAVLAAGAAPAWATTSSYRATSSLAPDALWAKVGDFCGIANWHPAIAACSLSPDGHTRTLQLKGGGTLVERLVRRDDKAHSYTYRILSGPLPVSRYQSTIKVTPDAAGSALVWTGSYRPKGASEADAKKAIDGIYQAGGAALTQ